MKKQIVIIAERDDLKAALKEIISEDSKQSNKIDFEDDKLSLTRASKFTGMSIPTFSKRVNEGIFKKHGTGRKIFFLKSEIIEALKSNA